MVSGKKFGHELLGYEQITGICALPVNTEIVIF